MKKLNYSTVSKLFGLCLITTIALLMSCGPTPQANVYASYTPPDWAPTYADASSVPYYYFPDYDMYYDVAAGQYYYLNNGVWTASLTVPYSGIDLGSSYTVLLDRGTNRPWLRNDFYSRNYPAHAHEMYGSIVRNNKIITNVPDGHTIVPRAYNENTNHVLFDERTQLATGAQARVATHEIPIRTIAPSMPAESHDFRYGGSMRGR